MDHLAITDPPLGETSKRFARRLLALGANRVELLMIEVQEERQHLLHTVALTMGVAVLALLAGIGFTAAVAIVLWEVSHVAAVLLLSLVYALGAALLYRRLVALQQDWRMFSSTLDQLRKDGACLEEILA